MSITPGPFSSAILDSFTPWLAYDATGDLHNYVVALGTMFDTVGQIVMDGGVDVDSDDTGWSVLLDPEDCPANFLQFLAQFNGTEIHCLTPKGQIVDEAGARNIVKSESGFQRGTLGAMQQAALRHLTGSQTLTIQERTAANGSSDPYHVVITFDPTECPDQTALVTAVEAVKPAGIQITYPAVVGFTWNQAIHTWNQDTMTWDQSLTTQP